MPVETGYKHIGLDEQGRPVIEGTRVKIIELIVERLAYGWSPEELHVQHPSLTLGQIHAALAYYWDHADELDRAAATRLKKVDALRVRSKQEPSPLIQRLRALGQL